MLVCGHRDERPIRRREGFRPEQSPAQTTGKPRPGYMQGTTSAKPQGAT